MAKYHKKDSKTGNRDQKMINAYMNFQKITLK